MPYIESVGSALLITFGLLAISIIVVGLSMWWLFHFFKNEED
jgi:hypothetical protein